LTFCISAIGAAPDCDCLENVSVARGNVILCDHGKTQNPEDFGPVPIKHTDATCECVDEAGDVEVFPGRLSPVLKKSPITYSVRLLKDTPMLASAASLMKQYPRDAQPRVQVSSKPVFAWENRYDLIGSWPNDRHFVVEIDNFGKAHLRFGNGEMGFQPPSGMTFRVTYRVGNGRSGNVGAEAISRVVTRKTSLTGVSIKVRNPLAARGGIEPEPMAEAKLFAPHVFRKKLQRAVTAGDYQTIAARNQKLQRASGVLVWTGSWYEADVAVDPIGSETANPELLKEIETYLDRFRRMGHDLHLEAAEYVPILLVLDVCALPDYFRADVKRALLEVFSNRLLPDGRKGVFHADNFTFGQPIYLSVLYAAALAVDGVDTAKVTLFRRQGSTDLIPLITGVLPFGRLEIAQLENSASFPDRGVFRLDVQGGK